MVDRLPRYSLPIKSSYIDDLMSGLQSLDTLPPELDLLNAIEDSNHGSPEEKRLLLNALRENDSLQKHYNMDEAYIIYHLSRLEGSVTQSSSWKREWGK
ncbi:hypothetical protein KW795_00910 [Candidatus Microgenomates bacterium]|nr:hypothetical protein [Candidatus Microgenomates bacterium]